MSDFWIGFGAGVFVMHCFWCAMLVLIRYAPLVDENENALVPPPQITGTSAPSSRATGRLPQASYERDERCSTR